MEPIGLVGPASPWAGGIASFTETFALSLGGHRPVRWLSWRPPRVGLPPGTHLDPTASPAPDAVAALGLYDRASWRLAGRLLHGCPAIALTLSHPALLFPYRAIIRAYRDAGGRVLLLCHNVVAHERAPGLRSLARRTAALADVLVVHSRAEADLARELAPSGVDVVQAFHPVYGEHAVAPWPPKPGARRLLAFGYVRPYKGIDDLIAALAAVPDATLDVVGVFQQPTARFRRLAIRHGVADRVRLHDGYVAPERVRDVFAAADLVVAPYRQASQSGVVHLAYSFGRPVVATAVGGLADAVVDGQTGILARPGDPAALAAAIRAALDARPDAFDAGITRVTQARTWDIYARLVLAAALDEGGRAEG